MYAGYLDCIGGISGDMFVGAILDAGWSESALREAVAWLGSEIAEVRVESRTHLGLQGKGIVVVPGRVPERGHRGLGEILSLLDSAPLPAPVVEKATAVFRRLAAAEARVHGSSAAEVHFHEIGEADALVDVVATCAGLAALGVERLYVSPLPAGSGVVSAHHGPLPVPSPAAALLFEGAVVCWDGIAGERTTPTGAALATTLGASSAPPPMRIERVGCGAGSRPLAGVPNLARLFLGEVAEAFGTGDPNPGAAERGERTGWHDLPTWGWSQAPSEDRAECCPGNWHPVVILETQIDDSPASELALICDRLRQTGALEVFCDSVAMKKGRQGARVTVVARPAAEESLMACLLRESSTLGVRRRIEWRRELLRRGAQVETPYGRVAVKYALRGVAWTGEPEFESCRAVAARHDIPFREVWRAAVSCLQRQPDPPGESRSEADQ